MSFDAPDCPTCGSNRYDFRVTPPRCLNCASMPTALRQAVEARAMRLEDLGDDGDKVMGQRICGDKVVGETRHTSTDYQSHDGITVSLIDGIIAIAEIVNTRSQNSDAVQEALADLGSSTAVRRLLNLS